MYGKGLWGKLDMWVWGNMVFMTRIVGGRQRVYRTESARKVWVEIIKGNFGMNWNMLYRKKGYSGES